MNTIDQILSLDNLSLPSTPKVQYIQWYRFIDSVGDRALRIVVVLSDETSAENRGWDRLKPIDDKIFDALRAAGVEEFPYVRFVTEAELTSEKVA